MGLQYFVSPLTSADPTSTYGTLTGLLSLPPSSRGEIGDTHTTVQVPSSISLQLPTIVFVYIVCVNVCVCACVFVHTK